MQDAHEDSAMAAEQPSTSAAVASMGPTATAASSQPGAGAGAGGPDDEADDDDEGRMDVTFIQGFADKIQRAPETARVKLQIPKRGEKDFEPLAEGARLQEMMLQNSRQALFDALGGVRGGASKTISHALLAPSSPYPYLLMQRGHMLDSMGVTVRAPPPAAASPPPPAPPPASSAAASSTSTIEAGPSTPPRPRQARIHLLPEEALYLLERGSLQVWVGPDSGGAGAGEWDDALFGVRGAVEVSVQEGFGYFIGRDGLTWERYQAYAALKRLGYTVQRARRFLPPFFLGDAPAADAPQDAPRPFRTWWLSIPGWLASLARYLSRTAARAVGAVASAVGLGLAGRPLTAGWAGDSYSSLFKHLRIVPAGHAQPIPGRRAAAPASAAADEQGLPALARNPYLPFFHVWKPATPWSKAKWDRGSAAGLVKQRPDYFVAVVEARDTPVPTLRQLTEVFDGLPDEPTGPVAKVGPQYVRAPRPPRPPRPDASGADGAAGADRARPAWFARLGRLSPRPLAASAARALGLSPPAPPAPLHFNAALGRMRNGDRALVVAVNDSGNTGWVRFGRAGFADFPVL